MFSVRQWRWAAARAAGDYWSATSALKVVAEITGDLGPIDRGDCKRELAIPDFLPYRRD
jgi:hypothetical protein